MSDVELAIDIYCFYNQYVNTDYWTDPELEVQSILELTRILQDESANIGTQDQIILIANEIDDPECKVKAGDILTALAGG